MKKPNKTIYVAMSGGVDSSVAAGILKKQGHDVVGVFMRPWQPWPGLCIWQGDREDALKTAAVLNIPLLTWDFSKEYKKEVGDYMIREYRAGRTPNPDVMCNKEIKFGLFLKKALKEGANMVATGHYVRLKNNKLYEARDKNKDQSYFLWTLTPEKLKHCIFPIGEYKKPDVRKLAKKLGLANYAKKDSQGVCFIGPLDMKDFLKKYIHPKKGKILDKEGYIIGEHDGVYYYTIGQRHGLNISDGRGPYYVTAKDIKKNIIYIGQKIDIDSMTAKISNINWLNNIWRLKARTNNVSLRVRIRYRSEAKKATLSKDGILKFMASAKAVTPGQSAVFYSGEMVLGGGVIN